MADNTRVAPLPCVCWAPCQDGYSHMKRSISPKTRFAAAAAAVICSILCVLPAGEATVYDIVVYGDSSGAVTAAIEAKRR